MHLAIADNAQRSWAGPRWTRRWGITFRVAPTSPWRAHHSRR